MNEPDPNMTLGWIDPALRSGAVRRDAAKLMSAMRSDELLDVSTRFQRFGSLVHVVWGDSDRFFPLSLAHRLVAAFPDSTLTTIPGGRTFISVDFPEQVAAAISAASIPPSMRCPL